MVSPLFVHKFIANSYASGKFRQELAANGHMYREVGLAYWPSDLVQFFVQTGCCGTKFALR